MPSIPSPFNHISTRILNLELMKTLPVFLYKPSHCNSTFIDRDSLEGSSKDLEEGMEYEVCIKGAYGTVNIITTKVPFYHWALAYLSTIYGKDPEENEIGAFWNA